MFCVNNFLRISAGLTIFDKYLALADFAVYYELVFEFSGFDPFECVLETVSRQPSVRRIWIDVNTALLQTNVADYVTLNVHMQGRIKKKNFGGGGGPIEKLKN